MLAEICQMQGSRYRHTMDINRQGEIQRNKWGDTGDTLPLPPPRETTGFNLFNLGFFFPFCLFKFKTHSFSFQESIFTVYWWGAVIDKVWNKSFTSCHPLVRLWRSPPCPFCQVLSTYCLGFTAGEKQHDWASLYSLLSALSPADLIYLLQFIKT